eukprot:SAG31_NODE_2368_length_5854_cov_19.043440_6_plen_175_part_00
MNVHGHTSIGNDSLFGTYMEEVPVDFLHSHEQWSKQHRFAVMFGFDGQHRYENRGITLQVRSFERNISDATTIRTLSESIKDGTGFEPWVWYWPPASSNKPKQIFRLIEHLATDWGSVLSTRMHSTRMHRQLFCQHILLDMTKDMINEQVALSGGFFDSAWGLDRTSDRPHRTT